jgi:hypothetical protein
MELLIILSTCLPFDRGLMSAALDIPMVPIPTAACLRCYTDEASRLSDVRHRQRAAELARAGHHK